MNLKKGRPLQLGLLAKVKRTKASSRFHLLPEFPELRKSKSSVNDLNIIDGLKA